MRTRPQPVLDPRRATEIAAELLARRPGYLEAWRPETGSPGDGLVRIWARYLETLLERLNQAPEKNRLAFLDLGGIDRIPATEARAPIVFTLAEGSAAQSLPAGTRIAAPPPPEGTRQIVFETERGAGLTPGRLVEAVSLWPGRDEYVDHGAALAEDEAFITFDRSLLEPTPHRLYLAHPSLLALDGEVELQVAVDLLQPGTEPLSLDWTYWDGEVWRHFARPECGVGESSDDGTDGLTRSGTVVLKSECAGAEEREVDEHSSFWLRAALDETLPLDPDQILPEASEIRLSAIHRRTVRAQIASFTTSYEANAGSAEVQVRLSGDGSQALDGVRVELSSGSGALIDADVTGEDGSVVLHTVAGQRDHELAIEVFGAPVVKRFRYEPPAPALARLVLEVELEVDAYVPEKAFADADKLDLTKPFYPLGQAPRPGSTFYFAAPEALSKPGAHLTVHLDRTDTPQDRLSGSNATALAHTISWEYHDGRRWRSLLTVASDESDSEPPEGDLDCDCVTLIVPEDVAKVTVNDDEDLYLRVRLLSGGYGFTHEVSWSDGATGTNTFTYVLPQPPALKSLRLSYVWEHGPFHAEKVLAENDFAYRDLTEAAKWPDDPFRPFEAVRDLEPALYLGFDAPFPVDRASLYFDLEEERGAERPDLVWEYAAGGSWRRLAVEDGTRHLAFPGTVSFIGPLDATPTPRFGTERSWIRARRRSDGPPPEVTVRDIHVNAVWASQRETLTDEVLGTSRGIAGESFRIRRIPVLEGERVELRELESPRATVEWRQLALDLLGGGEKTLRRLERRLAEEGSTEDVLEGDLRLVRDAEKRVTEVWVVWHPVQRLVACGADERCYALDRASGWLRFGDGEHGRVPPLGARVMARRYVSGGGRAGNVAAGAISQPLTGLAGVEAVFNPVAAEGGADAETMSQVAERGPRTLIHRGRALAVADLETMAREASPAVAVARALPTTDPTGRTRPGWVTLVVVPSSEDARPYPSVGLRERVRRYVEQRCEAGIAAARRITVTGPDYFAVDVSAQLIPGDPAGAGEVEERARAGLEAFLHPLAGGPDGDGWEPGRSVFLSDVAAVLERVEGVDAVERLELLVDGVPRGERVAVPPGGTVAAGTLQLQLTAGRP